jgi:hypothetical protein
MSNFLRFTHKSMFAFIILVLVTSGTGPSTASAQVNAELERISFSVAAQDQPVAANPALLVTNLLLDPGLEARPYNSGPWQSLDGTPFCNTADEGCLAPGMAPRTLSGWALFGRSPGEDHIISHFVTIPNCGATLQFYIQIGRADPGSGFGDRLEVFIDTVPLSWSAHATDINDFQTYQRVRIPIDLKFADGTTPRNVQFRSSVSKIVFFNVDDVTLIPSKCTISGKVVGLPGVKLSYMDGTLKHTISNAKGIYSFKVPYSWSGTVTPSRTCYKFTPPKRPYDTVTAKQPAQNFKPTFNPASPCAQIAVKIHGTTQGTPRIIPKNGGERLSFTDVINDGYVLVNNTGNDVGFVASQRVISFKDQNMSHYSELMGLPQNLLSTKYAFPLYDSINYKSELQIANVSNATTTVTVRILNNVTLTSCTSTPPKPYPYQMGPGTTLRVSCSSTPPTPKWLAGPLVVQSSGGNIITSLRVFPKHGGVPSSFSEIMGLPAADGEFFTSYGFPWVDNKNFDTVLRVAKVGNIATNVTVTIGGNPIPDGQFLLRPRDHYKQVPFDNVNDGPLRVSSSGGVPIIASLRIIPKNGVASSFSEVMGLPASQFSKSYVFPWYNNVDLNTQLQVGNLGRARTLVRVYIGGVEKITGCTSDPLKPYPYQIEPGTTLRVRCAGVNTGPLKVVGSAGVPIVASLRFLPKDAGTDVVFSEMMGLPAGQVTTGYYFPWYDNLTLNTQLRVAVP